MADDAGSSREEQQRELAEIRRSFEEIDIKVGSFEPAQPNGSSAGQPTLPAPATPVQPPPARTVVPPACLQTAQRGDELIALFTRNVRDRRLDSALKAYTLASQACRKEASP